MKRAYVFTTLVLSLLGILGSFIGPLSFVSDQELLIGKVYSTGLSDEQATTFEINLLQELTRHNRYKLVTPSMFQDLVDTRGIGVQTYTSGIIPVQEYARIANQFGVSQLLTSLVFVNATTGNIDVTYHIRETEHFQTIITIQAKADSFQDFIDGNLTYIRGTDHKSRILPHLSLTEKPATQIPYPSGGLPLIGWMVLLFYFFQLVSSLILLKSDIFTTSPLEGIRELITRPQLGWRSLKLSMATPPGHPGTGHESLWTSKRSPSLKLRIGTRLKLRSPNDFLENLIISGLFLFLFSWIFAANANMDYVRNFIAQTGGLGLADTVFLARIEALLRFLPLLLLNGFAYLTYRLTPRILPKLWEHRNLYKNKSRNPNRTMSGLIKRVYRSMGFVFRLGLRMFSLPRPDHTRIESWLVRVSRSYSLEITGLRQFWLFTCSYRLPMTLVSAIFFALSFPSEFSLQGWGFLGWISLVPLFLVLKTSSFSQTVYYMTVFGAFQSLFVNYWHSTYGLIALPFVTIISASYFFLYGLILGLIRNLVFTPRILGRFDWILWPLSWIIMEYSRSLGFLGYPWGYLGATQYGFIHIIQIAEVTGIWGVSFLVALVNSVIAHQLLPYPTRKTPWNEYESDTLAAKGFFPVIVAMLLFLISLIYGQTSIEQYKTIHHNIQNQSTTIALIQQNTDPRKHETYTTIESLMTLTRASLNSDPKPQIVFWPEGALPYDISQRNPERYPREVADLIELLTMEQFHLITGTNSRKSVDDLAPHLREQFHRETPILEDLGYIQAGDRKPHFNSVLHILPDGEKAGYYEKMVLVPFSEHFPFKHIFPWVYHILDHFNSSDWTRGWNYTLFETPAGKIATPVCFEDVFPSHMRQFSRNGAQLFAVVSNDYWSLTPVEAQQHAAHALFRSIENRIPMVRATTSGLTSYISPLGEILRTTPYYEENFLVLDIVTSSKPETEWGYRSYGDSVILLGALLFFCVILWAAIRQKE